MTVVYKLRHKETGLFWKPDSGSSGNVSKSGKLYFKKPSLVYVTGTMVSKHLVEKHGITVPEKFYSSYGKISAMRNVEEWEVVKYSLIEIK